MPYNPPPDRRPPGLSVPPPSGGLWAAPQAEPGSLALGGGGGPAPSPAPIVPPQGAGAAVPPPAAAPPLPPTATDLIGDIPPPPLPPGMDPGLGLGGGLDMGQGMPSQAGPQGAGVDAGSELLSPQDAAALLSRLAASRGGM